MQCSITPTAVVYFKFDTGGAVRNMERRSYTGGTWRLLDNAGTPNVSTDDTTLATGDYRPVYRVSWTTASSRIAVKHG